MSIDFETTPLAASYTGFYAKVLDNVFTQEECSALLQLAEKGGWQPAAKSTNFRNSDRVLVIDNEASAMIFERLKPFVEGELSLIAADGPWAHIAHKAGKKLPRPWKLVGVNPRLSFLRYGPGHYFKPHCDGLVELPVDEPVKVQKSFVTLHLYLNDKDLEGGATRFWTPDKKNFLDVEPRVGRVLIFQQRMLVHSGEAVIKGIKQTMRSDFMFEQV